MRRKVDFFKYKIIGFAIREKKIVKRVGDKVQNEKMRRTITETDNGLTFFLLFVNIQILTCSLPTKEIFSFTRPKSARSKSSGCRFFVLSREKYHYPGQGSDFRFFFSYFALLPPHGKWHCLLEIRIFFLAAIIRENFDMRPWIENGHRFAIHLLIWHSWLAISNRCKKLSYYYTRV